MHSGLHKYYKSTIKQKILFFALLLFCLQLPAQHNKLNTASPKKPLNPLVYSSFKKPMQVNPLFQEYIKPTRFELMYWPSYPLTPEQIAARDRRYEQSLGQQIVSDIIGTGINTLIYGKKMPPAKIPRF